MDTLEPITILNILEDVHPDIKVEGITVAYLQTLLNPYAESTTGALMSELDSWVSALLTEVSPEGLEYANVREQYRDKMNEFLKGATSFDWIALRENVPRFNTAKRLVIESLLAAILKLAGDSALYLKDAVILPWDVKGALADDHDLSQTFTHVFQHRHPDWLPVTMISGPKQLPYTRECSLEFVAGLLLFSDPCVGNHDFQVTMFGASFPSLYVAPLPGAMRTRFSYDPYSENRGYSVMVGGMKYGFYTEEFIQGFMTGAKWVEVDHRKYWEHLTKYDYPPGPPTDYVSLGTSMEC
jgi:hypothetical protein